MRQKQISTKDHFVLKINRGQNYAGAYNFEPLLRTILVPVSVWQHRALSASSQGLPPGTSSRPPQPVGPIHPADQVLMESNDSRLSIFHSSKQILYFLSSTDCLCNYKVRIIIPI